MTHYAALRRQLIEAEVPTVTMTFREIDDLVGGLPTAALTDPDWWSNQYLRDAPQLSWLDTGRCVSSVDVAAQVVTFGIRVPDPSLGWLESPPADAKWYLPTEVTVLEGGAWLPAFEFCLERSVIAHVITAWNPGDDRPTLQQNDEQSQRLSDDIRALGFEPIEALGSDPNSDHSERSWAVVGMKDEQAVELGFKYGQVAIFRIDPRRQHVLGCLSRWEISRDL